MQMPKVDCVQGFRKVKMHRYLDEEDEVLNQRHHFSGPGLGRTP
jgi:hypothetical protein